MKTLEKMMYEIGGVSSGFGKNRKLHRVFKQNHFRSTWNYRRIFAMEP